jgi:enoyl reductase-like protein
MPVTARLSRKFYETFGGQIASEFVDWFNQVDLTYRTDLERINELNFARFDAKVERHFAESELRWQKRFAEFETRVEERLAEYGRQLAEVRQEVAQLDARLDRRISSLESRLIRWVVALWLATALGVLDLLRL